MRKSEGFQKYLKNTSWLFIERVVRLGVVLAVGIYLARYLGPAEFGKLSYATGFVGLFFAFASMGLDEIVVRDLVRHPEKRDEILGTAWMLKFFGTIILFALVALTGFLKGMQETMFWLVVIIGAAEVLKVFSMTDFYFQAQVKAKRSMQVQMAQVLIGAAAKVVLILLNAKLIWFASVYAFEGVVTSIGYLIAYKKEGLRIRAWNTNWKLMGTLLRESWPLIIYGIALMVQAKIDQVMIGDMLAVRKGETYANQQVGQYSVALRMIEALGFLPVIIQKSLAPAVTSAKERDQKLYEERLLNQYRLMFLVFLITAVPLALIAEPMITLLYGVEFALAGSLLAIFAIRLLFTNMGMAKASFIANESLFKYSLVTAVLGAVVNIVTNYLFIPTLEAKGAVLATVVSFTVSIFLVDLFYKETRPNFKWMFKGMATFWKIDRVS